MGLKETRCEEEFDFDFDLDDEPMFDDEENLDDDHEYNFDLDEFDDGDDEENFYFQSGNVEGEGMKIKQNTNASQRTKNRLREHGPRFDVVKPAKNAFDGRKWILLRAVDTDWFGWLPIEEIILED